MIPNKNQSYDERLNKEVIYFSIFSGVIAFMLNNNIVIRWSFSLNTAKSETRFTRNIWQKLNSRIPTSRADKANILGWSAKQAPVCPMLKQSFHSLKDGQVNRWRCVSGTASLWGTKGSAIGFHLYLSSWRAFSITRGAHLQHSDSLHKGTFLYLPQC